MESKGVPVEEDVEDQRQDEDLESCVVSTWSAKEIILEGEVLVKA